MITVKSIATPKFEIKLIEAESGRYFITYSTGSKEPVFSEAIIDLNTAFFLFDRKLADLEGN